MNGGLRDRLLCGMLRVYKRAEPICSLRAVEHGERFAAKHGRTGFRRNFPYGGTWNEKMYATKQVEAYAVEEDGWLVLTVIVRFF